jgi:tetratricopeptide (TPR) repeat protein
MVAPIGLWLILKIHAIGWIGNPGNAPIDRLNLVGRLMTAPSILQFYLIKFVFPWKLATEYYWIHPNFSARYVLLPLLIDLGIIGIFIYLSFVIRKKASSSLYRKYLFFAMWTLLGLLTLLQIIPLDFTASETWFYFSMAGLLGMIGVVVVAFQKRINPTWFLVVAFLIISTLSVRTALRGTDWSSAYKLDLLNISNSKQDFGAYTDISDMYINQGNYNQAKIFAEKSISIFPEFKNNTDLGDALFNLGNYPGAEKAFNTALKYNPHFYNTYEDFAGLSLVYGNYKSDEKVLDKGLEQFPENSDLWFCYALFEGEHGNNSLAKAAIINAVNYGYPVNQTTYNAIINDTQLILHTNYGTLYIH